MAESAGTNQTLNEGDPLCPLVDPSVEGMMTERVRELCAEVEQCHETIFELKKRNRELENKVFEMQLELAKSKQKNTVAQPTPGEQTPDNAKCYINIEKVEQLNANVSPGAEVVHTIRS